MFCSEPDCDNWPEANGLCGTHNRLVRKAASAPLKKKPKPIKQVSDKAKREISKYSKKKKEFLSIPENQICRLCGLPGVDSIHHGAGKVGYWDDEARDDGTSLLLDDRFWIPIHSFNINLTYGVSCHRWVEENPVKAKEMGLSFDRL